MNLCAGAGGRGGAGRGRVGGGGGAVWGGEGPWSWPGAGGGCWGRAAGAPGWWGGDGVAGGAVCGAAVGPRAGQAEVPAPGAAGRGRAAGRGCSHLQLGLAQVRLDGLLRHQLARLVRHQPVLAEHKVVGVEHCIDGRAAGGRIRGRAAARLMAARCSHPRPPLPARLLLRRAVGVGRARCRAAATAPPPPPKPPWTLTVVAQLLGDLVQVRAAHDAHGDDLQREGQGGSRPAERPAARRAPPPLRERQPPCCAPCAAPGGRPACRRWLSASGEGEGSGGLGAAPGILRPPPLGRSGRGCLGCLGPGAGRDAAAARSGAH
jgi:hypothetical protein